MQPSLLQPIDARKMGRARARHLLNRAGFGIPLPLVDRLAPMSPAQAVQYFVDFESQPDIVTEPDWLESPGDLRLARRQIARMYEVNMGDMEMNDDIQKSIDIEKRKMNQEFNLEQREDLERLKIWWLRTMHDTHRPLQEKMTLFWHGHFATSAQKVKAGGPNYQLNNIFRSHAVGNFKTLAYEVGCSPAMMSYLDNARNVKKHPNENFARELMELFTLGVGNYTEDDIKEAARAFTGWATDGEEFVYNKRQHDAGSKTFLGVTGDLNGNDVYDIIFDQDAAASFIVAKLWRFFAYDDPEPEVVEGLSETLRESGFEIAPVLREMFMSQAFYSDRAVLTLIKSPVQLTLGMISMLEIQPNDVVERYVVHTLRQLGQDLFYPPNVKGWDGGQVWINTNTLMTRYNLANFLVQGVVTEMGGRGGLSKMIRERRRELNDAAKKSRRQAGARNQESRRVKTGMVGDAGGPKGFQLPLPVFDARSFFSRADGIEVGEIVDFLSDYFLGAPLRADQHSRIAAALGGHMDAGTRMESGRWDEDRLRGAVHLILSTAEFQVC